MLQVSMIEIPLTQGFAAIVDDEDFYLVAELSWCAVKIKNKIYAVNKIGAMHRLIMNAPEYLLVDHRDGNGLNNRRYNLRLATVAQNATNSKLTRLSSSSYRGVSFAKGKWKATIGHQGKTIHLGTFKTELEAAKAYDHAAFCLHGEFAILNNL